MVNLLEAFNAEPHVASEPGLELLSVLGTGSCELSPYFVRAQHFRTELFEIEFRLVPALVTSAAGKRSDADFFSAKF